MADKFCTGCKERLPCGKFHKNKGKKDGLQSQCKDCSAKRYQSNGGYTEFTRAARSYKLKTNFGIDIDQYEAMLVEQNSLCAICGETETSLYRDRVRNLAVDHDHQTGVVRGLLCNNCNTGLGKFKDNAKILQKAIDYLT